MKEFMIGLGIFALLLATAMAGQYVWILIQACKASEYENEGEEDE